MYLLSWACYFFFLSTSPSLGVFAFPTEHGVTSPTDVSDAPLHPRARPIFTELDQVMERSFADQTMLDPEKDDDQIKMRSSPFDTAVGTMSIFNRYKGTVIIMITARGAILITIPRVLLVHIRDGIDGRTYESHIKEPIFTKLKALITIWSRVQAKTTIEKWTFPDALRIITITDYNRESREREAPRSPAITMLEDDLYKFWTRQTYLNRYKVETEHSIQNVLEERTSGHFTDRFMQVLFSPFSGTSEKETRPSYPENYTQRKDAYGVVITWEPDVKVNPDNTRTNIVHYKIWIGSDSIRDFYLDEKLFEQDSGWYPDTIQPLRSQGPNVGCRLKSAEDNDGSSENTLDPINELRTQSNCNSIQGDCAEKVLDEVREGYECAPAFDGCVAMDIDDIIAEVERDTDAALERLQSGYVCVPKTGPHQRFRCPMEPIARVLASAKCIPAMGRCLLDHLFLSLELCHTEEAQMDSMDTSAG